MSDSISGLPSNDFLAENIYRVHSIDRDSGGRSDGERFERQPKEDDKESEEEKSKGTGHNAGAGQGVQDVGEPVVIRDDMILSDNARQLLESQPPAASPPAAPAKDLASIPQLPPVADDQGPHINITA